MWCLSVRFGVIPDDVLDESAVDGGFMMKRDVVPADSFHGSRKRFHPLPILQIDPSMSPHPYKLFVRDTASVDDFVFNEFNALGPLLSRSGPNRLRRPFNSHMFRVIRWLAL